MNELSDASKLPFLLVFFDDAFDLLEAGDEASDGVHIGDILVFYFVEVDGLGQPADEPVEGPGLW